MKTRINQFKNSNDNHKAIRIIEKLYTHTTAYIKDDHPKNYFQFLLSVTDVIGVSTLDIPYRIPDATTNRTQKLKGKVDESEGCFADDTGVHS